MSGEDTTDEQMSTEALAEERDRLHAEVTRLRVARNTGVPPELLANGRTVEEIEQLAADALAWAADTAPRPTKPAPQQLSYAPGQIYRSALAYMSPEQVNAAYREGRLTNLVGAQGPPPPRQNGEHR